MMIPNLFKQRMRQMLDEEYPAFEESLRQEPYQALRINTLKADPADFLKKELFLLRPVPWADNGFYYAPGDVPGKHPYHAAGVYYIQEPSAMAPAEYLQAKPGEKVLDLCGAPGGKSTQIAADMQGEGILVCNEIHPARAKILSENVERMGICNAVVANESPQRLAEAFPEYFDKILVDAPCSGEGMFRKNEDACREWSLENVALCAKRQDGILACAARMLASGGRIVYSTCTFAPEENEGTVSRFLRDHPEFEAVSVKKAEGMTGGRQDWILDAAEGIADTVRLFPHRLNGEGHFLAVLKKKEEYGAPAAANERTERGLPEKSVKDWLCFHRENLGEMKQGTYLLFGDQLYLAPEETPLLRGLKILRPGLHLGTLKKNRMEPSHALALSLKKHQVRKYIDLPSGGPEISAYLRGESIPFSGEKGWYLVTTDGFSIGWGKLSGGILKNHYPKGLRKQC